MKKNTLSVYNLDKIGVDVDSDNLHAPTGGFRQAQNIVPSTILKQAASIITRNGLVNLNSSALDGSVLGGITIPAFEAGDGDATLFIGFGD